jgi:hypothetical protein
MHGDVLKRTSGAFPGSAKFLKYDMLRCPLSPILFSKVESLDRVDFENMIRNRGMSVCVRRV